MSRTRRRVARHKTALKRKALSRPVRLALEESLLRSDDSLFDYGCGHGSDVALLADRGISATGWDPAHLPKAPKVAAEVVNLGYVLNVIEDPDERADALRDSWSLTRRTLLVSARLDIDAQRQAPGEAFGDGILTGSETFQKFFEQQELRNWLDSTLAVQSVALAPGVFAVFRVEEDRQAFMATRFRRRAARPALRRSDILFEEHKELLEPLMTFVAERGRLPQHNELVRAAELVSALGSIRRAFSIVRRVTGKEPWEEYGATATEDLLIYLALAAFPRPPRFSELPVGIQRDVRALFGSYKAGRAKADALLYSAGRLEELRRAAGAATVGKRMPTALYVHRSALEHLPPVLRVYEACGRVLVGQVEATNVIKLSTKSAKVSYLEYADFDRRPHPELRNATTVRLDTLRVYRRRYAASGNPPILHRKELLVAPDYPGREKFARLTKQEEDWALYANPSEIGTRESWNAAVARTGLRYRGHRLVRSSGSATEGGES